MGGPGHRPGGSRCPGARGPRGRAPAPALAGRVRVFTAARRPRRPASGMPCAGADDPVIPQWHEQPLPTMLPPIPPPGQPIEPESVLFGIAPRLPVAPAALAGELSLAERPAQDDTPSSRTPVHAANAQVTVNATRRSVGKIDRAAVGRGTLEQPFCRPPHRPARSSADRHPGTVRRIRGDRADQVITISPRRPGAG
jgi:hypothetical protein